MTANTSGQPVESGSELPDSGMATGNDETPPGGGRVGGPLDAGERALLEELTQPGEQVVDDAVEDSPAAEAAVADEAPIPPDAPPLA
jgi:hypothetical protein